MRVTILPYSQEMPNCVHMARVVCGRPRFVGDAAAFAFGGGDGGGITGASLDAAMDADGCGAGAEAFVSLPSSLRGSVASALGSERSSTLTIVFPALFSSCAR